MSSLVGLVKASFSDFSRIPLAHCHGNFLSDCRFFRTKSCHWRCHVPYRSFPIWPFQCVSGILREELQPLWISWLCRILRLFPVGISNVTKHQNCYRGVLKWLFWVLCSFFFYFTCRFLFQDLSLLSWTWQSALLLMSFGIVQFGFYAIVAQLLVKSNAVAINLSILSADFYSILVGVFVFQYNVS